MCCVFGLTVCQYRKNSRILHASLYVCIQGVFFGKLAVSDDEAKPLKASENPALGKLRRQLLATPSPYAPYKAGAIRRVDDDLAKSIYWDPGNAVPHPQLKSPLGLSPVAPRVSSPLARSSGVSHPQLGSPLNRSTSAPGFRP